MTRQLVFVHGRSQQHKNAADLKAAWIEAWSTGLAKNGLELPIDEQQIRFPYYGDTLDALVHGAPDGEVPDVIVRGGEDVRLKEFMASVITEVQHERLADADVHELAGLDVIEQGPQNWPWVLAILRALDRHVPGASAAALELTTFDVYTYLSSPGIRDAIEEGVRAAIMPGVETVVVGHSLGSVVSYNLLKREGAALGWVVPLYVTVGCPLALGEIRKALRPIAHPECAPVWFNALDPRDVVALYPLDARRWDVDPAVENKTDVRNDTKNRHGISGYLDDAVVARRIHDALTA